MQISKRTLRNIYLALSIVVFIGAGIMLSIRNQNNIDTSQITTTTNIIKEGIQILDITAKVGYTPSIIEAKSNQDTILRVSTNNTFDCSSALTIPKLGVRKNLPPNGKTEIAIAAQSPGSIINGTCSMGMYGFKIKFV